jgi:bacteriorhodopsin
MRRWRTTRVAGVAVGLGMVVVGWLALFTWSPTPNWARWTLGAGAALVLLAGVLRQPGD